MKAGKTKENKMPRIMKLVMIVAAVVFVYSGYQLYAYWQEGYQSELAIDRLVESAVSTQSPEINEVEGKITVPIEVDFQTLEAENPDIIGWIYCEDTPINYPIAQSDDNSYYLHKLPNGDYNAGGTIFVDYRNKSDWSDLNTIVYGHNMKNDSMFGILSEYKKQSFYDEHPEMWLLTKNGTFCLKLFAGFVSSSDSETTYCFPDNVTQLKNHIESVVLESTFIASDFDLSTVEKIVTLSTCSYETTTSRYVVLGSLVPIT